MDEDGASAIWYAAKENEFAAVEMLLSHGADVNVANSKGITPLHEAAANGSIRTCKLLVNHGAGLEAVSQQTGTALHFAVTEDRVKTTHELIQMGAQINATNANGITPLILSCLANKPAVARELLTAGADLSVEFMGGFTALHIAANSGATEMVQAFIECRAADLVTAANAVAHGATPLQLAAGMEHRDVVTLLQPLTKGFEHMNVEELVAQEKKQIDVYHQTAAKFVPSTATPSPAAEAEAAAASQVNVPEAREVSEEDQAKALALKEEGNQAHVAKDHARAIELYTQAIALNPLDAVLYSNRCAAYMGAEDHTKALEDARVAKALRPDWVKALFREGQCLEALGLYVEAACVWWDAVKLEPTDAKLEKRFQECVARGRSQHQADAKATSS